MAPRRPGAPGAGAAPRGPRRAERIAYSPASLPQAQWLRPLMIAVVVVALVGGGAGWYWYFRTEARDQRAAARPTTPATASATSSTSASPSAPSSATAPRPAEPDTSEPITLSAKDLRAALGSHAPLTADEAYVRIYQGREVTWNARVGTVTKQQSLVKLDLVDDDGVRIVAWCEPGREVAAGQLVTVRGRVTTKLADGFVVERCELR